MTEMVAPVVRHGLDESFVIAGFLGVLRVREEDDVARARRGFFQLVPRRLESLIDKDAAARGFHFPDPVHDLMFFVGDAGERHDGGRQAVHGEDGDLIHRS